MGETFSPSGIRIAVPPSSVRRIVTESTELSQFSVERDFNKLKLLAHLNYDAVYFRRWLPPFRKNLCIHPGGNCLKKEAVGPHETSAATGESTRCYDYSL